MHADFENLGAIKTSHGSKKDKCLLALAFHIVGSPKLMYKCDVYILLLHV